MSYIVFTFSFAATDILWTMSYSICTNAISNMKYHVQYHKTIYTRAGIKPVYIPLGEE